MLPGDTKIEAAPGARAPAPSRSADRHSRGSAVSACRNKQRIAGAERGAGIQRRAAAGRRTG